MAERLNFTLTQLEYALALHQHGNFARAAKACWVSQPTLSMQLQKLEDALGVVLFDRSKKPILLTRAGARVIAQMQTAVHEVRRINSLVTSKEDGIVRGELVVGVIPTLAPYLLPRLLPVLTAAWPGLSLRLRELQTQRIVEALEHDDIDAGLVATPLGIPQLYERPLYYEPFLLLCHRAHRLGKARIVQAAQLTAEGLWLLQEGHCLRAQVLDVCALRSERRAGPFEFESGSLETIKNLVDAYGGYTLLPALAVDPLGRQSRVVPFAKPVPAREIGLVHQRTHYKRELLDALVHAVIQAVPDELRTVPPEQLAVLPVQEKMLGMESSRYRGS